MRKNKKNFVLDTNVILHDFRCLDNFEENDVYVPIVVLEELDKFKKGNDQINYNAREFLRQLDDITDDNLFSKGATIGNAMGKLYVVNSSASAALRSMSVSMIFRLATAAQKCAVIIVDRWP